jgi:carbamoyltransferase
MTSSVLGVAGATRNTCVAACVGGEILAACEQERVTRVRGVGFGARMPIEAVEQVLALARRGQDDVTSYAVAESGIELPSSLPIVRLDHHEAHAASAFLTSGFERAAVFVCDTNPDRELSVWSGERGRLKDHRWPWHGPAFASLYSECAELFDFAGQGREHHLESLAHLGRGEHVEQLRRVFRYVDGSLQIDPNWRAHIREMVQHDRGRNEGQVIDAASAVQQRLGELLLEVLADVRAAVGTDKLCLGGGLFYNTYFNTLIRRSGIFENVFVPINPGNAGLAVGAALLLSQRDGWSGHSSDVSPFLGPEYDSEAIKNTLDGCKLSYSFGTEEEAIDVAVDALMRGQLVGWFQGRMEYGPRALGNRSILANPCSPYVLDNLNCFLRKRARWRAFGVSVCEEKVADLFCGPARSRYMEFEYGVRDDRLRHVVPTGATSIRVQTVEPRLNAFWELHRRMAQVNGTGVLVNTSLNGFHEPMARNPGDAVRVFYGTGLDVLVIGRFILRK